MKVSQVRTISAVIFILDMLDQKIKEIRTVDSLPHHVAAHGHIRTALDLERKALSNLTDPKSMSSLTYNAIGELLIASPSDAIALITRASGTNE